VTRPPDAKHRAVRPPVRGRGATRLLRAFGYVAYKAAAGRRGALQALVMAAMTVEP
jgi:hypothetical protein